MSGSLGAVDAVGELIRTQSTRIRLTDQVSYKVVAPCLLQQLEEALGLGSQAGGRTIPSARPLINPEAWDLYVHVMTATHEWAEHLGVDRSAYRRPVTAAEDPLHRAAEPVREPAWMAALAAWVRPVAWDEAPEHPAPGPRDPAAQAVPVEPLSALLAAAAPKATPVPMHEQAPKAEIPPVGRLLRACAAQAVSRGDDAVTDVIARLATRWAGRIRTLLQALDVDERVWPIRGEACSRCGATSAIALRHDERCTAERRHHPGCAEDCEDLHCDRPRCRYRTPAIEVRLQPAPGEGRDTDSDETLLACWWCLSCGDNGWLEPRFTRASIDTGGRAA